jgi:hypothetical protein
MEVARRMSAPKRIQLRRTKGWRKPEGAVVVARPSRWGNPYRIGGDVDAAEAVRQFRDELGRDLACWCPLDEPCHADVLLELANRGGTDGR